MDDLVRQKRLAKLAAGRTSSGSPTAASATPDASPSPPARPSHGAATATATAANRRALGSSPGTCPPTATAKETPRPSTASTPPSLAATASATSLAQPPSQAAAAAAAPAAPTPDDAVFQRIERMAASDATATTHTLLSEILHVRLSTSDATTSAPAPSSAPLAAAPGADASQPASADSEADIDPAAWITLPELARELQGDEGLDAPCETITLDRLERVLYTRLSHTTAATPSRVVTCVTPLFPYLLSAWQRARAQLAKLARTEQACRDAAHPQITSALRDAALERLAQRQRVVQQAQALLVSYAGLVLMPEMAATFAPASPNRFDAVHPGTECLAEALLEHTLDPVFFNQFLERFHGDGLVDLLQPFFALLAARMRATTPLMATSGRLPEVMTTLTQAFVDHPLLMDTLVQSPLWCPEPRMGKHMEQLTFLGPFLGRTAILPDATDPNGVMLADRYFGIQSAHPPPQDPSRAMLPGGGGMNNDPGLAASMDFTQLDLDLDAADDGDDDGDGESMDNGGEGGESSRMASPQLYGAPIGRDRNLADVMAAQETLRGTCLTITNALSALTMPLIKRGPQTKDAMLGWLARAFDANKARGRLRVDRRHVASDGFMFNCLKLLLLWVQPMTDFGLTKLHLIDPAYLFTASTRLEAWSDETAMAVDRATWLSMRDRWQQRHTAHHQAAPKFVTEVFYLTLAGLHYGFLATIKFYTQFQKDIDHTASEIKRLRATWRAQTAAAATPPAGSTAAATLSPQHQATLTAFMLRKAIANHDHMVALQLAMQAALFDRATWDQIIAFYRLLAGWMLRILATEPSFQLAPEATPAPAAPTPTAGQAGQAGDDSTDSLPMDVDGGDATAATTLAPPLPAPLPVNAVPWSQVIQGQLEAVPRLNVEGRRHPLPADTLFATLPEWVVEDYVDFYVFVCRHHPVLFQEVVPDDFLTFAMVILDQPHVIKNPYLKSKLVEVLFYFTLPIYRDRDGQPISRVRDSLAIHPLCQQRLVRVLLRFYVDVEQTGMASQFYDKFNIRYNISQIIRAIWDQPLHRHEIIKQARALTSFVRFVNLLMNDTTYLLDEALTKLGDIHSLQKEMDSAEWATQPQAYQEEKRQALSQAERQATSCMSLGNETVHMLQLFTQESEIVEPFMEAYIVERLAAMMNYNLAALAGPKCTELKVRHPERYHFNPKRLLSELILIYLHLADQPAFVAAMAKDGRSYARQHFERAGTILIKHHLLDPGPKGLGALTQLVSAIEAAIAADVQEEDDLGDVPDHFMDPLMFTIMNEPVILPTSNMTLDLSTIKSHLLSDTHDPFNRQPLVIEDVVPNTALKAEIAAWRAARREAKQAANAAP